MSRHGIVTAAAAVVMFITITGCQPSAPLPLEAQQEFAEAVDPIVENSLQGLSADNHAQHVRDFDEDMIERIDPITFPIVYSETIGVLGQYQSKTLDRVVDGGSQFTVVYRTAFENDPEALTYVVFWTAGPDYRIASLWIDSDLFTR